MTTQEFKDYLGDKLPKKLNKVGEWLLSESWEPQIVVSDMKAVLK